MFTIIGGDGKEYGPVTAEQARSWIAAGRANLDTKAKAVGSEEWRRLGDFPEFGIVAGILPTITQSTAVAAIDQADRGTRLGARLIDWLIGMVVAVPGVIILGAEVFKVLIVASQGKQPDFEQLDKQRLLLGGAVLVMGWLICLVVQIVLLSQRGQSIGKIITRIKVVRLDGSPAGFVHAWLIREAAITVIGGFLSVLPIIGPLLLRPGFHLTDWCMIFRDDQRCLHDLMAGTRVVKA
jgi:uncharacterized RDD family membrane protein YckC